MRLVQLLVLSLACGLSVPSFAGVVVITTDTFIAENDFTLDGQEIVVRGATLTIDGEHSFASLTIERDEFNQPGVLTHTLGFTNRLLQGTALTISGDLFIEGADGALVASRIDLSGRGHAAASGPGAGTSSFTASGGGHGGIGAPSSNANAGGPGYGSVTAPDEFGSGGGNDVNVGTASGGRGGGALRLIVDGSLVIDGSIVADGLGGSSAEAGGGAGGSIRIECGTLGGSGMISARGGSGSGTGSSFGGGGAGGRVAIVTNASTLGESAIRADGGQSGSDSATLFGAAGTVWIDDASATRAVLIIDNDANIGESTTLTGSRSFPADLIVRGSARFGPATADDSFDISFGGDAFIEAGSTISATGRGFGAVDGPGAGTSGFVASGAGHGGIGASASSNLAGGGVYGSVTTPMEMGSGGGNDVNIGGSSGGRGGGAIRLAVAGTLTVEGTIEANGLPGTTLEAGGGSGGSVRVDAGTLAGSGWITANGGAGSGAATFGGGGAGGRIAINAGGSTLPATNVRAFGGQSGADPINAFGGAGTIWFDDAGATRPVLIVDNGGNVGEFTALSGATSFVADLLVRGGGRFGPAIADDSFDVSFVGDAVIEADGSISATGRGFAGASGPGAGTNGFVAGGAGHGGIGATASSNVAGGVAYGSATTPIEMGSGGGNDVNIGGVSGGRGGGALRLAVGGSLTVDGTIEANGFPGMTAQAGGGAGGSIRIEAALLDGTGSITANGGFGAGNDSSYGGGGAGGRIAITAGANQFDPLAIRAHGARSGTDEEKPFGAAGTVWIDDASAIRAVLIVDNGGDFGEVTAMTGVNTFDADLIVRNAGRLGPAVDDDSLSLFFSGDALVTSGGAVTASRRGFAAATGPGAGSSSFTAGGGGHGGVGAPSSGGAGSGGAYGDEAMPTTMGSGGGNDINVGGATGGRGGGALRLSVLGILTVDASIEADGSPGATQQAGGGAGGSLWIDAGAIVGSGVITADGGDGAGNASSYGGGGGGGRIAIYCCAVDLPAENIRAAGGRSGLSEDFGGDGTVGYYSNTITVTQPPRSIVVAAGETAQFTVIATGDGLTAYQWFYQGKPLVDGPGIAGAQTATLTIADAQCGINTGAYRVAITDSCGVAFSLDGILTVPILGDLNGDCVVNGADLGELLSSWGECPGCAADLNGDGVVDGADLGILLSEWSSGA